MFDWLFKRKPKPEPEPVFTAAPARPESDYMPARSSEPNASAGFTGAVLAAIRTRLQGQIAEHARRIVHELDRQPCVNDVRQVLDLVVNSEEATIRPIPTAAKRAMLLARNPQSNLRDVAEAFERDPSLAEGLLRLANSAWYRGGDDQVDSLREALQRTGSSGAEIVIMENALKGTLCRPGGAYDAMVAQVWLHLSRTAALSRSLANTFRVEPEQAYMLGLLHDTGKLVLFDAISEYRHRTRHHAKLPFNVTRTLLQELHEPLGGLALLRWGLDPELAAAVADHHRRSIPPTVDPAAELLFVAERADLALASGKPCDPAAWIAEGHLEMGEETLRRALDDATGGALRFTEASERLPRAI